MAASNVDDMAQQYAALEQQRQGLNQKQQYRTVYFVRHGSTALNGKGERDDRIRGWSNVPLSSEGWKEAFDIAKKLKAANVNIGIIFTSDLDRAVGTAQAIAGQLNVPVIKTQLLRPWNLGTLTGKPSTDVHPQIAQLATKTPNTAPPSGESFNSFKARGFNGIRFCLSNSRGLPICIVSHHRLERLIEAWVSAGQKPSGEIKFSAMFEKGDPPSFAEKISFNLQSLAGSQPTSVYAGASVIGPDCIGSGKRMR